MKVEPTIPMEIELAGDLIKVMQEFGHDISVLDLLDMMAVAGHALVPDFGGVTSPAYLTLIAENIRK